MTRVWLPCGYYHENYAKDQGWWQTPVIKGKMILLLLIVFVGFPLFLDEYYIGVANMIGYTALGALGVQLLIGYAGLITLGHAAFIAVGAYTSTILILKFPWPEFFNYLGPCLSYKHSNCCNCCWLVECSLWTSFCQGQRFLSYFNYNGRSVYHGRFYLDPICKPNWR